MRLAIQNDGKIIVARLIRYSKGSGIMPILQ
jgi:hypothetical protein